MSNLKVEVLLSAELDKAVVVEVAGEMTRDNLQEFKKKVDPLVEDKKKSIIIMNFGDLEFLDSQSIGYLLDAIKRTERTGQIVVFTELHGAVQEVMELVGVNEIAKIYANNEEAIEKLKK